ncbi:MAG: hypothetical protein OXN25_13175 [Candidatus Poribacteria bacterium]|nr:hypothetical protein [Candidatus Poribacteria bacterium]
MSIVADRERLSQTHNLEWIRRDLKATEMVTVYRWDQGVEKKRHIDYFILSELVPQDQIEQVLSEARIGDRYGTENEMEPLIICRSFGGIRENYNEISEEFRHFHNLYHDRKTDKYIKIDDAGNETMVAIVKPNEVQIRFKEIRQFLAIKEMYLSLLFEFNEYSEYSVEELGLSESEQCDFKCKGLMCWTYRHWDIPVQNFQSISRLRGRKLIEPLPKSKSGFGDFAEEPEYVEFIVDVDDNGDEVYHTCNPRKLKKVSGENPDAPWDITPIHFRKQVLDKYYNEPSKYSVEGSVESRGLWSMQIDNDNPDKVCVLLDHLGIHLPYAEQLHWKSHNIPPEGDVSDTFYRRMVLGEWASPDQPDLLFKQSYDQLQKACDECLDWQLLKPLSSGDEYRLQRLRIFAVDEESHFKDSILDLANILIERLNEERLEALIPVSKRKDIKRGINRLEYVLNFRKVEDAEKHIIFLRCLWDLRNTRGGSHRELLQDSRYKRGSAHFDLENLNRPEAFAKILREAVQFLDFLILAVRNGKLSDKSGEGE